MFSETGSDPEGSAQEGAGELCTVRLGAQIAKPPPRVQETTPKVPELPARTLGFWNWMLWHFDTRSTIKDSRGQRLRKMCALILEAWVLVFDLLLRDPIHTDLMGAQLSQRTRVLGCTPQTCKACTCPASRPKKKPVSNRDMSGFMHGGSYTSESRSWGDTPPCVADCGRDVVAVLAPGGRRRLPVVGEADVRLARWLSGKLSERHVPHHPFDKLSWWRCSDLKIRTVTSWGGGKDIRRSAM